MKRKGVSTLSIRSYLWALRCLAHFENTLCFVFLKSVLKCLSAAIRFMITLVSVLKSVNKASVFESVLKCFV